jgi:hypothetical protein
MLRHMYGLKTEIDLSFLTGRELIQLAIGVYQVQFGFDQEVGGHWWVERLPSEIRTLHNL